MWGVASSAHIPGEASLTVGSSALPYVGYRMQVGAGAERETEEEREEKKKRYRNVIK